MIFVKNINSVKNQEWATSEKYPGLRWKFLVDADFNGSKGLSCGFAEILPGGNLTLHHHEPDEIYIVNQGSATLDKSGELEEIKKGDVCAVIFEAIQGVGGLDEPSEGFIYAMDRLCKNYNVCLIADEVQSGFSRSGTFFAYQKCSIKPNIITMAKGMGNGFPVGGILAHSSIESKYGMLGTTFGGNHLACSASLAVLDVIKKEGLQENAKELGDYFTDFAKKISSVKKVKGRGLMLGLEFDFPVGPLRKELIYNQHIFTGGSSNKNLLRILPPLTIQKKHFDIFFQKLEEALKAINV